LKEYGNPKIRKEKHVKPGKGKFNSALLLSIQPKTVI